ncbi:MAG: zinc ribbon domain-containing protein, partial [Oscillospiraceae bacterium]
YGFENTESIRELDEYIIAADLKRRTYNGTVFDTPEDMKRAMANELELQALCVNLGALDEDELRDLAKHINGVTADDATRSKYLVKVKIAQNRVEESMLEQLCLSLPMMDANETVALRNQVANSGYAESVVKPKLADINDHLNATLRAELDNIVSKLDTMTDDAISVAAEAVASDRYPAVLSEHYLRIIENHAENKIKSEIEAVYSNADSLDLAGLKDVKEQLSSERFPKKYTAIFIADIDERIANYEKNEVTKLFENIDFADSDELDKICSIIEERNFSPALLEPYAGRIDARRQEICDEELTAMCSDIENMPQEKLDDIKYAVSSSDKYSESLVEKVLDRIERRECELKNTELAELCKYIFDMDQDKLDELKNVLTSGKYDESLTSIYLKKVAEREGEIRRSELEELCEGIEELTEEQLLDLRADITGNERFADIAQPYCDKIDTCIENLKYKEFNALLDTVDTMDPDALESFRRDMESRRGELGEDLYARSEERAAARANAIELEKLDAIIADIDSFDVAGATAAINEINAGSFTQEHKAEYVDKLENKINELYTKDLDSFTDGIDDMNKEQLTAVIAKISDYNCPAENKAEYIHKAEKQISSLAEKEIRDICGDISTLSVKKCFDIIIRIRTLSLDDSIKNQYLDSIEAHILALKEEEQRDYLTFLKSKINELNVSTVSFLVPSISNLFYQKYGEASKTYVSSGRYELPIFMHENDASNGFTLTTEYFYYISKGVFNRIKIDELVSFQPKKGLMGTSVIVTERNGNTSEITCAINKQSIDTTTKAMTALISYIKDKRSAERMKELLENAVNERAQDIEVPKAEPVKEAVPVQAAEAPAAEVTAAPEPEAPAEEIQAETAPEEAVEMPVEVPAEEAAPAEEVAAETAPAEEPAETATEPTETAAEPAEEAPKVKFCDQCGAKISSPTAKFCAECGNKLF